MRTKPSLHLARDRARMSAARSCLSAFSSPISRAWSDSCYRAQRCELPGPFRLHERRGRRLESSRGKFAQDRRVDSARSSGTTRTQGADLLNQATADLCRSYTAHRPTILCALNDRQPGDSVLEHRSGRHERGILKGYA